MTKSELIQKLAAAEGIILKAAELAINVTFENMAKALAGGKRIEIRGLGSFKVKKYEGYSGRTPPERRAHRGAAQEASLFQGRKGASRKGGQDGRRSGATRYGRNS